MPSPSPPEVLALLADPVRWQLVTELARSDRRVGELVERVDRPQNAVSYHLGALRRAGLVSSRRSAADGRDVYYRVDLARCRDRLGAVGGALHPGSALAPSPPVGDPRPRRARVLFLCTGNSGRSQIAEALAEHRSGGRIVARSAGSHPKPLHPDAVRVLADRGIDISGRSSKPLTRFARQRFDRVVTLCDRVREVCPEFPGAPETTHWSMPDPAAGGRAAFVLAADEIDQRVALLVADLTTRPEGRIHHG